MMVGEAMGVLLWSSRPSPIKFCRVERETADVGNEYGGDVSSTGKKSRLFGICCWMRTPGDICWGWVRRWGRERGAAVDVARTSTAAGRGGWSFKPRPHTTATLSAVVRDRQISTVNNFQIPAKTIAFAESQIATRHRPPCQRSSGTKLKTLPRQEKQAASQTRMPGSSSLTWSQHAHRQSCYLPFSPSPSSSAPQSALADIQVETHLISTSFLLSFIVPNHLSYLVSGSWRLTDRPRDAADVW